MTSNGMHDVSEGQQPSARPLGWWLKEADAVLNAAFDAALDGTAVDRRGWQVLTTLASKPMKRSELLTALSSFDSPQLLDLVVDDVLERGWVEESRDLLRLTSPGIAKQQALNPQAGQVRDAVSAVLSQDDYVQLVNLLARLVHGMRSTS